MPRIFADLSLTAKLLSTTLLLMGGVVLLTCGLTVADHYQEARAKIRTQAAERAEMTAHNAAPALVAHDGRAAEEVLRSLYSAPEILSARLFDERGVLIAEYTRDRSRSVNTDSEMSGAPGQRFHAEYLETFRPVVSGHREIGMLAVATDLAQFRFELAGYWIKAVLLTGTVMVVAYVLSANMLRALLAPLGRMTTLVNEVAETKNYELRVPVERNDEIGRMGAGFNTVLARIEEREEALRRELAERTQVQRRLDELSHYDSITKLPNRHYFSRQFDRILLESARSGSAGALMLIDLHDLKEVNDSFGHDAGDTLLLQVAKRLGTSLRENDVLCRVGGDAFALVVEEISGESHLIAIAEKLVGVARRPFILGEREVRAGISIGIAVFPVDGNDTQTLVRHAETATARAKDAGKNTYCFFEPDMLDDHQHELDILPELQRALEHNELRLVFQPQVMLADNRIRGMEALLRWQHPERGLLMPGDFMPLAEDHPNLMRAVADWTLEAACAQIANWRASGLSAVPIAVNVSDGQLADSTVAQRLHDLVNRYNVPAEFIELEIAENLLMSEPGAIEAVLELRKFGVRIAVDHFGAGYFGLSQLKDLPVTALKIDREFVHGIAESARYAAITRAVVTLASDLGLDTVAEGVEGTRQLEFLRAMGCRSYQGFSFSPAVTAEEAVRFLTPEVVPLKRMAIVRS